MSRTMKETPSQTAGPYVHIGTLPQVAGIDVPHHTTPANTRLTQGTPIRVRGTVRDGAGELVTDALIEIWQADGTGAFQARDSLGWARSHTDFTTGIFEFETVKPGQVAWIDGTPQAPHITLLIFARGINIHLQTRIYFADEEATNADDPVLAQVPENARKTLLAVPEAGSNSTYRFDISLQGENETVFFDI